MTILGGLSLDTQPTVRTDSDRSDGGKTTMDMADPKDTKETRERMAQLKDSRQTYLEGVRLLDERWVLGGGARPAGGGDPPG
jgi:hypothetical protein